MMPITAKPAMTPPAMAPVCEVCPPALNPTGPWVDVIVFEEPPTECDGDAVVLVLKIGAWELEDG